MSRLWSFILAVVVVLGVFAPNRAWARAPAEAETRVGGIDLVVPVVVGLGASASADLYQGAGAFTCEHAVGATLAAEGLAGGGGGGANIVYRGLAAGENPVAGLVARAPEAANSIASHVAGARASQWISTTRSLEVATSRFGQNGVVAIDLSKVGSSVVDLTAGIPGIGRSTMLSRWAINAQEVLIQGRIPAEAIMRVR